MADPWQEIHIQPSQQHEIHKKKIHNCSNQ
jgi:hypothetical protein